MAPNRNLDLRHELTNSSLRKRRSTSEGSAVSKNKVSASIRLARASSIDVPRLAMSRAGQSATKPSSSRSMIAVSRRGCFMIQVLDKNPIPPDQSSRGTFGVLRDANQERMRTILEAAASDTAAKPGSNRRKMGDRYAGCMDTAAIDARGVAPLQPDFDRIAAIQSEDQLGAVPAAFQRMGRPFGETNGAFTGPFRLTSGLDPTVPSRVTVRIVERDAPGRTGTSIFSLPDRDYYFRDDQKSRAIRDAFVTHVSKMPELSGTPSAAAGRLAPAVWWISSIRSTWGRGCTTR